MYIIQPGVSPQRIVEDQLRATLRTVEQRDRLRIAKAARCETRGCHPILETVSTTIVAIGGWLNRWAAPPERRVRISSNRTSQTTQPA
jgi:hypothetical protein